MVKSVSGTKARTWSILVRLKHLTRSLRDKVRLPPHSTAFLGTSLFTNTKVSEQNPVFDVLRFKSTRVERNGKLWLAPIQALLIGM